MKFTTFDSNHGRCTLYVMGMTNFLILFSSQLCSIDKQQTNLCWFVRNVCGNTIKS